MCLEPQGPGGRTWINAALLPPPRFVSVFVEFAVMSSTHRDRELIAHLPAEGATLRKAQMMRISGLASADQARLLCDKPNMFAIANAPRLGMGKHTLVNASARLLFRLRLGPACCATVRW